MTEREQMESDAVSPFSRNRAGEAYLCQFPDTQCDAERFEGTGFCVRHLAEMRLRRLGVSSGVLAESARLEAEVQEDYERWSATLALTAPIPSEFLPGGSK